jgi:hypothetical protein|tara:strand:+ start:1191 stop:1532 length:342 start_codon:yes stop_codon:yes gene_type:complete
MDPFQRQIELFIELSILIQKKCIKNKGNFKNASFNTLFETLDGKAELYYSNEYDWSIKFNGFEYIDYSKTLTIEVSSMNILDILHAVNYLRSYLDNFEENLKPKRRTLNFNKQ